MRGQQKGMVNNMEQHDLLQGSSEWHAHRAAHFNASDAPAMLGISKYKSRQKLLHEMATGITPEVDAATQKRFDDGHRFEALARPLAENIVGKALYPVTGSEGKLSASYDGLTSDDVTNYEHKSINNELRAMFDHGDATGIYALDDMYLSQIEQQVMLSGSERTLFMASKWDEDGNLIEERHCWVAPCPEMRQRLIDGWAQFEIDLEEYKRKLAAGEIDAPKEMPKAEVKIELPALFVHAKGEITEHNMDAFGEALTTKLAEVRSIALVTDQDFSNAKEAAKKFRETAKAIKLSKDQMLAQTETIGEAARKMDAWAKDLNETALQLEKDVEREDLAKKQAMILEGKQAYADHIAALEEGIKPIRLNLPQPDFAASIKGKRNYSSMQDAIHDALSNASMAASNAAKDVRAKLTWCKENAEGMSALFPDLQQIIVKPMDDFTLTITSRIEAHKKAEAEKLEAERKRIEAEATAKAEREAAAKLAEETARIRAEEEARARAKVAEEQNAQQGSVAAVRSEEVKPEAPALSQEPAGAGRARSLGGSGVARMEGTMRPELTAKPASRPSREALIKVVAFEFGVEIATAEGWLIDAFHEESEKVAA